jgi:hypothetical protein
MRPKKNLKASTINDWFGSTRPLFSSGTISQRTGRVILVVPLGKIIFRGVLFAMLMILAASKSKSRLSRDL